MECSLYLIKHSKGCTPRTSKNLGLKEMLNCFIDLTDGAENGSTINCCAPIGGECGIRTHGTVRYT